MSQPALKRWGTWRYVSWCLAVWCAGLALTTPARAGDDNVDLAACLPEELELVLVVQGASTQMRRGAGPEVRSALLQTPFLAPTIDAWDSFSKRLRVSSEQAFDQLMGGRFALGVSTSGGGWVIISQVEPSAADRVRKVLEAAPRRTVAGHFVLAIEEGRYSLGLVRTGGELTTIVMTPFQSAALMDQVVMGLAAPRDPKGPDAPDIAAARRLPPGEILALYRRRPIVPLVGPEGEFIAVAARQHGEGWSASVRASPRALGTVDKPGQAAWSDWPVRAASEGALAVFAGLGPESMRGLASFLGLPRPSTVSRELRDLVEASRWVFAVHPWKGAGVPGGVGLSLTFALEGDRPEELAKVGDALMRDVIPGLRGDPARLAPYFQGFMPSTPRYVPLGRDGDLSWRGALGEAPALAWVFGPPAPDPASPLQRFQQPDQRGGAWWVTAITPRIEEQSSWEAQWVRAFAAALANPGEAKTRERLTSGYVRVAELARWMEGSEPELAGSLTPLGAFDSVTWDAWFSGTEIEGAVQIVGARAGGGQAPTKAPGGPARSDR